VEIYGMVLKSLSPDKTDNRIKITLQLRSV